MTTTLLLLILSLVALKAPYVESFFSPAPEAFKRTSANTNTKNTLSDEKILQLAEDYVLNSNGFFAPLNEDAYANDFVFRGGVVGPLNKQDYCITMGKLGIAQAFDLSPNPFGFTVDPEFPNAARFFVRYTGKQVQQWQVPGTPFDIPVDSNNNSIVGPTESWLLQFNEKGQTKFHTISAPMLIGNNPDGKPITTGKYGAVLGLFSHVGLTVAADAALNANVRKVGNAAANLLPQDLAPPKTASKQEDIPSWYTEH